jgi:hypothetical protein
VVERIRIRGAAALVRVMVGRSIFCDYGFVVVFLEVVVVGLRVVYEVVAEEALRSTSRTPFGASHHPSEDQIMAAALSSARKRGWASF